jgi:hypothetical protein
MHTPFDFWIYSPASLDAALIGCFEAWVLRKVGIVKREDAILSVKSGRPRVENEVAGRFQFLSYPTFKDTHNLMMSEALFLGEPRQE